jgi:thiol:disulfide interchange protein DsbD
MTCLDENLPMPSLSGLTRNFLVAMLLVSAAFCGRTALAQDGSAAGFKLDDLLGTKPGRAGKTPKPQFDVSLEPAQVAPGGVVTLTVGVKLPTGFYIYGTDGEFGGRTKIHLAGEALSPVDPDFIPDHAPKRSFDQLFNVEISKFHDGVVWKRRYRVAPETPAGMLDITGTLEGQYCSGGEGDIGGQCIPILPPHEFAAALTVTDEPPVAPEQDVPAVFEQTVRPERGKDSPVEWTFRLTPENAKPGETVNLAITAKLDSHWHTFSLTHEGLGGTATEIAIDAVSGLKPVGQGFVADKPFKVDKPLDDLVLEIHEGEVTWSQQFEVLPNTAGYGVVGSVAYQVCQNVCLPVHVQEFVLGTVAADATPPAKPADVAATPGNKEAANPDEAVPVARPQDRGLIPFLLTAIGFGFVSLLTPCVFPMVPITVSFFLKQAEKQHHRPLAMAIVYCVAIVLTFTILGVGISAIFGAGKLNQLANNPWLNVAIGGVFVIFALNMLGMFEIRVPGWMLTFTATKESTGGYVGAIFMALTFTLTSFTCTFAFAGTLLVAAAQGDFYWPIIGMLAFGTAFALPFFVLALMPSLLKKLPKSGGWMNAVKVVMGLVEIGAAVKFFSVADLAFNPAGPVLFDYVIVLVLWMVLCLAIGLYLLGVYRFSHDSPVDTISVPRGMLALGSLSFAGLLAVAVLNPRAGGGWLMDQVIAFAPPNFHNQEAVAGAPLLGLAQEADGPKMNHHGLVFSLDIDKAIATSTKLNEPLFIDFTGVNCVNCRLMEKRMSEPAWKEALAKFVGAQLYVDVDGIPTIADADYAKTLRKRNVALQQDWFGDVSMPSYVVATPDGKTILSTYVGLERESGEFLKFLNDGMAKWEVLQKAQARVDKPVVVR